MRWLHISGLHFGYESNDFDAMRKSLLARLAPRIGSIDCLFITGDLQYAPSAVTEAQNQAIEYIQKLQETLGVSPEDTFLVPGNHDVNRTAARAALVQQQLEQYMTTDGNINSYVMRSTQSAQASFLKARHAVCKQELPSISHYCQQRHGYNILCLNTALLSFRDGEDGELILGSSLLDELFRDVEPGLPLILLAHHDSRLLASSEIEFFRNRLRNCLQATRPGKSDSVMYLCGHSYNLRPQSERLGDYTLYTFTSGVQWNHDAPGRSDYTVMVGEISDNSISGHVQAYRWVSRVMDFLPDNVFSYEQNFALDGRWYFPTRPLSTSSSVDTPVSSWLHLSDLHVFQEADKHLILEDYDALCKIYAPSFLIVTGDFRHISKDRDYQKANAFLEEIMRKFKLSKAQVFLVPGNHDVNRSPSKDREAAIQDITSKMEGNKRHYNAYSEHMESLLSNFSDYDIFIKDFYRDSGVKANDERVTRPSGVYHVLWNDKLHIVCMNTALISDGSRTRDGSRTHKEIVDINALTERIQEIKKNDRKDHRPILLIGHHGLDDLYPEHEKRIRGIIERYQISAYLHGDIHQYATDPILPLHLSSRVIPSIACGKSAPESGDSESDIGAVYYEWRVQKNISLPSGQVQGLPRSLVTVKAFRWDITGFHLDTRYMHDIVKDYTFDMLGDIPN